MLLPPSGGEWVFLSFFTLPLLMEDITNAMVSFGISSYLKIYINEVRVGQDKWFSIAISFLSLSQ